MLFRHGSKDYRLAETESIGAFHALQQLGIPTRLLIFPNENHWFVLHQIPVFALADARQGAESWQ
jgi:dipeptidyl aminopeptidase/acylaminoacyl peptidase